MPGELTRFQAGRSGNPAGRPKDHGVVAAVRKRYGQTGARLIEALHVSTRGTSSLESRSR